MIGKYVVIFMWEDFKEKSKKCDKGIVIIFKMIIV